MTKAKIVYTDLVNLASDEELWQDLKEALEDIGNSKSYAEEVMRSMKDAQANHVAFIRRMKIYRALVTVLIAFAVSVVVLTVIFFVLFWIRLATGA